VGGGEVFGLLGVEVSCCGICDSIEDSGARDSVNDLARSFPGRVFGKHVVHMVSSSRWFRPFMRLWAAIRRR
jgi:hypothetical protein